TNRADEAIALYRRALAIVPDDKGLLLNLGLAYLKQDSHAEALPLFRKLATADPRHLQARELEATCELYLGRFDEAAAALDRLRPEDPGNAGLLYLRGVAYLKQKQPEEARRTLEEFLASAPAPQANFVQCKAYYDSALFEEAAAYCRKTLALDANFSGARRELGKVLVSQRSLDAEAELRAAIRQNPNDAEALYFLGGFF